MQEIVPVLFLVGVFLLFWVAIVRPQTRRRRELVHMQSTLEVGDEVMLTSGVYGTIHALDDDVAQIEVADGVVLRVARGAIGEITSEVETPADAPTQTQHDAQGSEEN